MECLNCQSNRIVSVRAKCNDLCHISLKDEIIKGYVPHDFNIGGGDYIDFRYCLDCGRIQDVFPLSVNLLKK